MESNKLGRRSTLIAGLICAWAVLVSLIFLWQAVSYRGLIAFAAEWQFNLFGRYYPTLSYLLFVILFGLPVFLLIRGRWWEADADRAGGGELRRTVSGVTRFLKAMFAIALGCVLVAIVSALLIFTLPSSAGPVQTVQADLGAPLPRREGATMLEGSIVYSRTAALDQDVWFARHDMRFAPVVGAGRQDRGIRYFVELRPEGTPKAPVLAQVERRRGILKKNALPGELVRLYRYAGFNLTDPYYVLYASDASLRWPHVEVAVELLLVALCFAVIGGWQWLVRRRLRERADGPQQG